MGVKLYVILYVIIMLLTHTPYTDNISLSTACTLSHHSLLYTHHITSHHTHQYMQSSPLRSEYEFESRGKVYVKGKGDMETFFINQSEQCRDRRSRKRRSSVSSPSSHTMDTMIQLSPRNSGWWRFDDECVCVWLIDMDGRYRLQGHHHQTQHSDFAAELFFYVSLWVWRIDDTHVLSLFIHDWWLTVTVTLWDTESSENSLTHQTWIEMLDHQTANSWDWSGCELINKYGC